MERERFEQMAIDYFREALAETDKQELELFLKEHPDHAMELEQLRDVWAQMDAMVVPETSEEMDARFFGFLNTEVEKTQKVAKKPTAGFLDVLGSLWRPRWAYGFLLLAVGVAAGYFLGPKEEPQSLEPLVADTNETEEVREQLVLTLLDQPSANKRLQAVTEATKMNKATESVIEALFATLNKDPNVNVRLAAVESLSRYVENPLVRMGLIQSITQQESPLVQIALADLMVALQEEESVNSMRQLLKKPNLDTTVSKKIKESINQII
ncbi:MAG: HEAT repeat domain-containing protein [Flavobacteriaceae bacterium]